MVSDELRSTIEATVRTHLAPVAVRSVDVAEGEDHDANDVLFVTIDLPSTAGQIPGDIFLDAMTAVSGALLQVGDERLPYLRTVRDDEVAAEERQDGAL